MAINPARLTVVMSEVMRLVAQLPEDDQQLKRDSLEGETDFYGAARPRGRGSRSPTPGWWNSAPSASSA